MTSHVIAYRSLKLLFGTHTFHFNCFFDDFYCVFAQIRCLSSTPASNLGYLAPPPGQFFMGAKLFIGTPWMGNEGVLKKNLVWAM